jgi:hypothetical protein
LSLRGDDFIQIGRPDHLAGKPRAAIDARDRRAFGRGHDGEIGKPRAFQRGLAAATEQRLIDHVAGERADQTPEDGAERPEHGTAGRGAGHCKEESCHDESRRKTRLARSGARFQVQFDRCNAALFLEFT